MYIVTVQAPAVTDRIHKISRFLPSIIHPELIWMIMWSSFLVPTDGASAALLSFFLLPRQTK